MSIKEVIDRAALNRAISEQRNEWASAFSDEPGGRYCLECDVQERFHGEADTFHCETFTPTPLDYAQPANAWKLLEDIIPLHMVIIYEAIGSGFGIKSYRSVARPSFNLTAPTMEEAVMLAYARAHGLTTGG